MGEKYVKDLQYNDICYMLYPDGYMSLLNIIDIQVNINKYSEYKITFMSFNNGSKFTVTTHVNNTYIDYLMNDIPVKIYFDKYQLKKKLNEIIENCNESLETLN